MKTVECLVFQAVFVPEILLGCQDIDRRTSNFLRISAVKVYVTVHQSDWLALIMDV